jgi:hypothetical protein
MAWCGLELCEVQIIKVVEISYEPSLVLNLTQVPKLKEEASECHVQP